MAGRNLNSIDSILDRSSNSGFRKSNTSSYVGKSLGVPSTSLRHSSIAGEDAAGISQPRKAAKKPDLDPSDPSTWTSSPRPRAASETQRVGGPVVRDEESAGGQSITPSIVETKSTHQNEDNTAQAIPTSAITSSTDPSRASALGSITETSATPTVDLPTESPTQTTDSAPTSFNSLATLSPNDGSNRRLSHQTASFSTVDSDRITRIVKDDKDDEQAVQDSSEEDRGSSDMDEQSPGERGRTRTSGDPRDGSQTSPESVQSDTVTTPEIKVDEVHDTKPQGPTHSGSLSETQSHKVTPKSNYRGSSPAALSAMGDDDAELKRAKAMELRVSPLDETIKDRTVKMIIRGDWNSFQEFEEEEQGSRHEPRLYLLGSDLSSEATYALEWTIGTLLKDGDTILLINAVEDDNASKTTEFEEPSLEIRLESAKAAEEANATMDTLTRQTTNQQSDAKYEEAKKKNLALTAGHARSGSRSSPSRTKRDSERITAIDKLETDFLRFVRKTTLQVRCMIETIHCRSPRHLILNAIDELEPTLVVVGTRGLGTVKNVVMGSFSNYLVTKSSVPVMVARKRLKKPHHAKISSQQIKMTNNLTPFSMGGRKKSLSQARID